MLWVEGKLAYFVRVMKVVAAPAQSKTDALEVTAAD